MTNLFYGTKPADFAVEQAIAGDITEVADPLGGGQTVMKFSVLDTHDPVGSGNPRAQLMTSPIIPTNWEGWLATEVLLPTGHPTITNWLTFFAIYGPPEGGSAPVHMEASYDRCVNWERTPTYNFDGPIEGPEPFPRNEWKQFVMHLKHATAGWVEWWIDGVQVVFFESGHSYNPKGRAKTTKLEMQTIEASINGGGTNHVRITYYRKIGQYTTGTAYYKGLSVATTKEDLKLGELEGGGEEPPPASAPSELIIPSRRAVRGLRMR